MHEEDDLAVAHDHLLHCVTRQESRDKEPSTRCESQDQVPPCGSVCMQGGDGRTRDALAATPTVVSLRSLGGVSGSFIPSAKYQISAAASIGVRRMAAGRLSDCPTFLTELLFRTTHHPLPWDKFSVFRLWVNLPLVVGGEHELVERPCPRYAGHRFDR